MAGKHLSEIDIQQIVLEYDQCPEQVRAHFDACGECQSEAAQYSRLFSAIKQQEKAVFDFDLSGLVMKELPVKQNVGRFDRYFVPGILFVAFCLAVCAFYFFRSYLSVFFATLPSASTYLILTIIVSALIILGDDIFSRFHKLTKILNSF